MIESSLDPYKIQHGSLSIKAYRLAPNLMELEERKDFGPDAIKEYRLTHENFMDEVPIIIKNSHLVNSLLCELQDLSPASKPYNFFDLSTKSDHIIIFFNQNCFLSVLYLKLIWFWM